jgi:hypothetical protein
MPVDQGECEVLYRTHYARLIRQSSPQHPLHPGGMKPTLCGGDDLEEQDLLPGGEP